MADPVPAAPTVPARSATVLRMLALIGVGLLIFGCAVTMLIILGSGLGAEGLAIGLVAAILPVPVLVACFLWLDRYEPEPVRYLALCFGWGASVATLASLGVNRGAAAVFADLGLPDSLVAVLVAPFIEELTKAILPIVLLLVSRREFSGITDGIVYCGLSAVGFAMVENVLYLGGHAYATGNDEFGPATGLQLVFGLFLVRILATGFAHPLFTAMTGVGLGVAARSGDRRVRWAAPVAGLLTAMMLHGTWNLMVTISAAREQPLIMLYGYVGLMMPIFFGMVGLAIWLRAWEGRLTERVLPHYVRAGWLSPPEVAALSTLGRRHSARRWARRVAGEPGLRAMRDYQFAATRLALLRDGVRRGLDTTPEQVARAAEEERQLLDTIVAARRVFVGRDPQTPSALWDGIRYQLTFPDGVRRAVDAPVDPVVPIPVILAPAGVPAGLAAGPPPGVPPGYLPGVPPGYPAPVAGPGYPPSAGYLSPPGWPPPGPAYPPPPAHLSPPGYASATGHPRPGGYPPPPGQVPPGPVSPSGPAGSADPTGAQGPMESAGPAGSAGPMESGVPAGTADPGRPDGSSDGSPPDGGDPDPPGPAHR